MSEENRWSEYSRLVLKELETLASSIQALNAEIQELKQEITRMRERDDITSPSQLGVTIKDVEDLKIFKTKAITIFAVIQFMMALSIWAVNFFK